MHSLETVADHRAFFLELCTSGLQQSRDTIDDYPSLTSEEFATIVLDCMAREPYEITLDYQDLTLLQSMQLIALTQIALVDLPSIIRMTKRSHNIRTKYRKRVDLSGWDEKPVIRVLNQKILQLLRDSKDQYFLS